MEDVMEVVIGIRSGGTARHGGHRDDIKIIVDQIHAEHPRVGENVLIRLVEKRLRQDDDALRAAAEYIVETTLEARHKLDQRLNRRPASPQQNELARAATAAIVDATAKKVLLLALIMPNGLPMHANSGKDMASYGHAFRRIAARLRPDELVGNVLTEADVAALM
jgi:hypothetical protein